jgi:shikimate kinase
MQRVILVGFMGSGKTFFGKKLAEQLKIPFIDSDFEIEQLEQLSIADIFKTKGEPYFRDKEKQFIQSLIPAQKESYVLSVGGGLPCFNNLMEYLNQLGTTIYLNCSVDTLFKRLQNEQTQRPLLQGIPMNDLRNYIHNKLGDRVPFYLQSKIIANEAQQNTESLLAQLHSYYR